VYVSDYSPEKSLKIDETTKYYFDNNIMKGDGSFKSVDDIVKDAIKGFAAKTKY